jgi:Domain of unknown function (DUF4395)
MKRYKQLICPLSKERVDENRVRFTALAGIVVMGSFFITGYALLPVLLAADFYLRAFTRRTYSPLSFLAHITLKAMATKPILIDKAPKVFAARIGLLLSTLVSLAALLDLSYLAYIMGSVLVLFSFLECGLNFCMGCWLYTYVVYPLVRKDEG